MNDVIIGGVVSISLSALTYWLGKGRSKAEIQKISAEASSINSTALIEQMKFLSESIEELRNENVDLKKTIKSLKKNIYELEFKIKNNK